MKHVKSRKLLHAYWNPGQGCYTVKGRTFSAISLDGDNWLQSGTNEEEDSIEFCEADILCMGGGPRDNVVVG